jgi:hypothetical protein
MVSSRRELFRRGGSDETFGDKMPMISISVEMGWDPAPDSY